MKIEPGDIIKGKNEVFQVVRVKKDGVTTVYDLNQVYPPPKTVEMINPFTMEWFESKTSTILPSVTRSHVRHLGKLIKAKDAKVAKILFSSS